VDRSVFLEEEDGRTEIDSVADESALENEDAIRLIALFDHEEIGSRTAQGADCSGCLGEGKR
jgi:aspartyl aminopeptidase